MAEKDKKLKSDWFTKKYGAYNMSIPDWYDAKNGRSTKDIQDWHTEKQGKKKQEHHTDWLEKKHGKAALEKTDWYADKYGSRTEFPAGYKSGMDPGNLDRIAEMYEKRFGNKNRTSTRQRTDSEQTVKKEPL